VILVDTHVVIWLAFDPKRFSPKATAAIEQSRNHAVALAISDISLMELANFARKGRFELKLSIESFLQEVESRFVVLPMTARICARMTSLPANYPKDPADRVIGATALVQGMSLVTADRQIRKCGAVQTIW
jgi:PIN domain nuclease of toxin-antitoxin system